MLVRTRAKLFAALCAVIGGASQAHPPSAIVVTADGSVYFSDLERVWMIDARRHLRLVRPGVPGRHVHEMAIGPDGAVWGEQQIYDSARQQWPAAIWRLSASHRSTYVVPETRSPLLGTGVRRDGRGCTFVVQNRPGGGPLLFSRCPGQAARLLFGDPTHAASYRQVLLSSYGGTAVGPDGSFYFRHKETVRRRTPRGAIERVASGLSSENFGIAVGAAKELYVAEFAARRVIRVGADGRRGIALTSRAPFGPSGVTFHAGSLYVLEAGAEGRRDHPIGYRVRRLSPTGAVETLAVLPSRAQHN